MGVGDIHVYMQFKVNKPRKSVMYQVLYVPELVCNLFSVRAAAAKGNHVKFGCSKCWIQGPIGKLCGIYRLNDR